MEGSNKLSVDDLWNIVVFEKLEFFFSQHTVLVGGRQSLWFLYLLFIPSFPLFKTWVNQTYVFFGKLFFYGHKIKKASLNFIFPKNFLFPFFIIHQKLVVACLITLQFLVSSRVFRRMVWDLMILIFWNSFWDHL